MQKLHLFKYSFTSYALLKFVRTDRGMDCFSNTNRMLVYNWLSVLDGLYWFSEYFYLIKLWASVRIESYFFCFLSFKSFVSKYRTCKVNFSISFLFSLLFKKIDCLFEEDQTRKKNVKTKKNFDELWQKLSFELIYYFLIRKITLVVLIFMRLQVSTSQAVTSHLFPL